MIVIARNNGPFAINSNGGPFERKGLKEGKAYEVIQWSYQIPTGAWITKTKDFLNPRDYRFFIRVINEYGIEHDYWNDYFLSSKEIRDIKIDNILK